MSIQQQSFWRTNISCYNSIIPNPNISGLCSSDDLYSKSLPSKCENQMGGWEISKSPFTCSACALSLMLAGWAEPQEPGSGWGLTSWVSWHCPVLPHCSGCHAAHAQLLGMENTAWKMGAALPGEADPQCQIPIDFGSMSPHRHLEEHERCFIPAQWLANTWALPQIPHLCCREAKYCRQHFAEMMFPY